MEKDIKIILRFILIYIPIKFFEISCTYIWGGFGTQIMSLPEEYKIFFGLYVVIFNIIVVTMIIGWLATNWYEIWS